MKKRNRWRSQSPRTRARRPRVEALEGRHLLATFTVVTTDDAGAGSLRQAILDANFAAGADRIEFAIPGAGPHTIRPASGLPAIADPVVIDGYSQPGAVPNANPPDLGSNAVLRVELDGTGAGASSSGLVIMSSSSTVRGLAINRFGAYGILLAGAENRVQGNFIGTDISGTRALGNARSGVYVTRSDNNTIGGPAAAERNVIAGNEAGVSLSAFNPITQGTTFTGGNLVQGNLIGTDVTGVNVLGNRSAGVGVLASSGNLIGGTTPGARNIISGNGTGVDLGGTVFFGRNFFFGSDGNRVLGNFIGTDVTGRAPLGNTGDGVVAAGNVNAIGGATDAERNVITGNAGFGVSIPSGFGGLGGTFGFNNRVQGNFIGIDATAASPLGNARGGVRISGPGTGNAILSNSIAFNGGLGIDLSPSDTDGVTLNDPADADTGPNTLQNFPDLISASSTPAGTSVRGTLHGTPGTAFTIEFFANPVADPSGFGEGQGFLGATTATTDAAGNAGFTATTLPLVPAGWFVTATATDPAGNTSEFSRAIPVGSGPVVVAVNRLDVRNRPTLLTLAFSAPLDPAAARRLGNYRLTAPGRDRILGTRDDRRVPLRSATVAPDARAVFLASRTRLPARGQRFLLTVRGTPPQGLVGQDGLALDGNGDGQPGDDFVTTIGG